MTVLASLLALVFTGLSALHVFWALGGRWGVDVAIPRQASGRPAFVPGPGLTLTVAAGLLLAALVVLAEADLLPVGAARVLVHPAALGLGGVFLLCAVGDFRRVGVFRRERGTAFAVWDARVYTPLCLILGLGVLGVALA